MSRILLVDDSPHAQRIGESILREEGYEVVSVTDGLTALTRLDDVDPDLILADVILPRRSGYDICQFVKTHPRYEHVRVVLTAGMMDPVDEAEAQRVRSDGLLKKPFENSVVLEMVKPLLADAIAAKEKAAADRLPVTVAPVSAPVLPALMPERPVLEPELVRAAVTVALDRALPLLIEEITKRVLLALDRK